MANGSISREEMRERKRQKIQNSNAEERQLIMIPADPAKSLIDDSIEKRVCAYCRVSTDDPAQTTSYELQKKHYEEQISSTPGWTFAGIYADEGISATSLKNRDEFNRMIADCYEGKIDVIITKNVSRFARNVVDCLSVVRKLAQLNPPVGVKFETEGFFSLDNTSEMILTVLAAAAQEESKTKSNSMNWSLEQRFNNGNFLTPVLLGFDHDEEGNLIPKLVSYKVQVPYNYYICYVTLKNNDLSHLHSQVLTEDELELYSVYMATLGNRPDLFPESEYTDKYINTEYPKYEIPAEVLTDERFAAIIAEAEKYLGYPYVFGGNSPSTSFDCSGYVSWVYNHSGWNIGRPTAQGLYDICTPISAVNVKPGDLVFFEGTYDAGRTVTHVGIYVGNNMMIHCGDPIQYDTLTKDYWQEHFYAYGRMPNP